jgi:hypothetical protein
MKDIVTFINEGKLNNKAKHELSQYVDEFINDIDHIYDKASIDKGDSAEDVRRWCNMTVLDWLDDNGFYKQTGQYGGTNSDDSTRKFIQRQKDRLFKAISDKYNLK